MKRAAAGRSAAAAAAAQRAVGMCFCRETASRAGRCPSEKKWGLPKEMGLAGDVREMGGVPVACGEVRVCDSAGTGVLTGHWIFAGHAGWQGAFQRFPAVRFGGRQSGSEEVPLGGEGYGGVPVGAPGRRSLCTPPWCADPLRKGHRLVG